MTRRHVLLAIAAAVAGVVLLAVGYRVGGNALPEGDAAPVAARPVYVVQEFSWRFVNSRAPFLQDDERPGKPVRVFAGREPADAHCRQLNLQKRATTNPFQYLPTPPNDALIPYTSLGIDAFLALVRAEGLTPPAAFPDEAELAWAWREWWEEHHPTWDARVVERLWAALDRLAFYEVVEVSAGP